MENLQRSRDTHSPRQLANPDQAQELFKVIYQIYVAAAARLGLTVRDVRPADVTHLQDLVQTRRWARLSHRQKASRAA